MFSSSFIRLQVESELSSRIPAALTPLPRTIRPKNPTGIPELDDLLGGGFPIGAVTELVGAECTGRTSLVLSFIAQLTQTNKVCAWVDTSNALDPLSAASMGVDLRRLLWVRCGELDTTVKCEGSTFSLPAKYLIASPQKKGLHGGGFGPHPRREARDMSKAVSDFFAHASPRLKTRSSPFPSEGAPQKTSNPQIIQSKTPIRRRYKQYDFIERALRSTDLILQTGGFSAIVVDLASIAPEYVARIELSTWHRYRVAAEKMQTCVVLLTQHSCAKSGSELQLRLLAASPIATETTVFCGMQPHIEVQRQRFHSESNVVPIRKPVQRVTTASWKNPTSWAGTR
jgi:recombination protein RecA